MGIAKAQTARLLRRWPMSASPTLATTVLGVAGATALFLVLLAHGLLPGLVNDEPNRYLTEGAIRCEHALGFHEFVRRCHVFGEPFGFPLLINGPVILLGSITMWFGASPAGAYWISGAIID